MYLIIGAIMLLILAVMYFQVTSDAKYQNDKLFLITIDKTIYESEEIQTMIKQFKQQLRLLYVVLFIVGCFLLLILQDYAMFILLGWLLIIFYCAFLPLKVYRKKLKELKKLRDWPIQIDEDVHIDLALSKYMESVHFTKKYFILPIVVLLIETMFAWQNKQLVMVGVTILQLVILILVVCFLKYIPNKTYCESSDVNIQLNTLRQKAYYTSFFWLFLSDCLFLLAVMLYLNSAIMFLLYVILLMVALLSMGLCIIQIIRFQTMSQRILNNLGERVYRQDMDDYWKVGFFGASYCNPNDPRSFVSSQNGLQAVPNTAKPAFRYVGICITGCMVLFFAYLFGYPYALDVQSKLVDVSIQNNQLMVESSFYDASWPLDSIQDVTLVHDLGEGRRNRGTDVFVYGTGEYNYDAYGECTVYLALLHPQYIVFHTSDGTYIINDDVSEQTIQIYEQLKEAVNSK